MPTKIKVTKGNPSSEKSYYNGHISKMEYETKDFFDYLATPSGEFEESKAFDKLLAYIQNHHRMLYSVISNIVYAYNIDADQQIGTIMSNLDKLINYCQIPEEIEKKKRCLSDDQTSEMVDDTKNYTIKLWDHVSLANHQYHVLKQTDTEYDEKFKVRISAFKEELTREVNGQLLTMVSIFTALAFLIFGSISSLDGIFENNQIPLLKTMAIGLVWGICVLNMLFVFLFCIGKMTKLSFKSDNSQTASIFRQYPIVWWSNFTLSALLLVIGWLYFISKSNIFNYIISAFEKHTIASMAIGSITIIVIIAIAFIMLRTKSAGNKTDEYE